jgi:adenosylcobyric acid synthase
MAKVVMVQGTMSNVGKSLVVAGLCRVFKQDGYRVAPFKSQNMALNSYITEEGLEMGRAQVMQAEAAGIAPRVCMNPILLKPTSDVGSQVIVNGEVKGSMTAGDYFKFKKQLIPDIIAAFRELEKDADIIVIEGAGSPAEINLKSDDIVNMGMAKLVDAPVLLVGDIDRGGVFAQLLGTMNLLEEDEKERVKGLIINKFRGDKTILDPGIDMLEEKADRPVVGVLPYTRLNIDDEDSMSERLDKRKRGLIDIGVVRLPRMSNYTDLSVFERFPEAGIRYIDDPREIEGADMLVIPGTKNTIGDLKWLRETGFEAAIKKYSTEGIVFGICGGYQMLGMNISDPHGIEEGGSVRGMGLLDIDTEIREEKVRTRVEGEMTVEEGPLRCLSGKRVKGYEIHMGASDSSSDSAIVKIYSEGSKEICKADGASKGNVYGTYLHGIFDSDEVSEAIISYLADKKGINRDRSLTESYDAFKEKQYDILADMIRENMDMEKIYSMLKDVKIADEYH